jgi:hypothetical protein
MSVEAAFVKEYRESLFHTHYFVSASSLPPRFLRNPRVATGKKGDDREAELEAAIEKLRQEAWKTGQTLPTLRHAFAPLLARAKALMANLEDPSKTARWNWRPSP